MDVKREGLALRPFPLADVRPSESSLQRARAQSFQPEPRCEMCGSVAIATHCKRICLRCGFMTGCSEGL
jgi:hypothetical protein